MKKCINKCIVKKTYKKINIKIDGNFSKNIFKASLIHFILEFTNLVARGSFIIYS